MAMVGRLVPDGLWELFQRAVPAAPVRPQGGGRRRYGDREVLAAILFVATTACTWRPRPWPGRRPIAPVCMVNLAPCPEQGDTMTMGVSVEDGAADARVQRDEGAVGAEWSQVGAVRAWAEAGAPP
jgi:hypothetical protein